MSHLPPQVKKQMQIFRTQFCSVRSESNGVSLQTGSHFLDFYVTKNVVINMSFKNKNGSKTKH